MEGNVLEKLNFKERFGDIIEWRGMYWRNLILGSTTETRNVNGDTQCQYPGCKNRVVGDGDGYYPQTRLNFFPSIEPLPNHFREIPAAFNRYRSRSRTNTGTDL